MHNFTPNDLTQAQNLARLLKKSKMELEGLEILAASDVIKWVGKLIKDIDNNLVAQQSLTSAKQLEDPVTQTAPDQSQEAGKQKKQKAK